jgi:hypothetical protein
MVKLTDVDADSFTLAFEIEEIAGKSLTGVIARFTVCAGEH